MLCTWEEKKAGKTVLSIHSTQALSTLHPLHSDLPSAAVARTTILRTEDGVEGLALQWLHSIPFPPTCRRKSRRAWRVLFDRVERSARAAACRT